MNGDLTELAPRTWLLRVPVRPMPATPGWTNCCIFVDEDGEATIIDAGDDHDGAWSALLGALQTLEIGLDSVRLIMATHLHCDHMGIAARLQRATGARFTMHAHDRGAVESAHRAVPLTPALLREWAVPQDRWAELEGLPPLPRGVEPPGGAVDCADGDIVASAERRFRVLHVPGHTAGHIAVLEESSGVLMTGDVVLPDQNPGVGLGGRQDDALGAYLSSLRRLGALGSRHAVPGHGPVVADLATRCAELLDHQSLRAAEVESLCAHQESVSVWSIAERLTWSREWSTVRGARLRSCLHHVDMHLRHLGAQGHHQLPSMG